MEGYPMATKTSRRSTKRRARFHRMSKREQANAIEAIYSTSKRSAETIRATWEYLGAFKSAPGALAIVEAVLNRQITELAYLTTCSKRFAEHFGLAVQS
jgi:hypothetical protein